PGTQHAAYRLRPSTGQVLEPVPGLSPRQAVGDPTRRLTWVVDTAELPEGPLSLWIVGDAGATDPLAEPVVVRVVRPAEADIIAREAETASPVERPEP